MNRIKTRDNRAAYRFKGYILNILSILLIRFGFSLLPL
jgi:hypothetical protein